MPMFSNRVERYQQWLARYCGLALVVTVFVLYAGAETTSIVAGMVFKGWPLSNGSLNPPGWLHDPDMFAEHSHRLLVGVMGTLAIGAMIWVLLTEARRWVRRVAVGLIVVIVVQALLGGARVLTDKLNTGSDTNIVAQTFAVCHATMAEVTTCIWVTLVAAVSRGWMVRGVGTRPVANGVRRWATATVGMLLVQIIIGAIMRHGKFALAIPTFPWSSLDHHLLPPFWNLGVAVNFAHRIGAALVTVAFAVLAWNVFRDESGRRQLGSWMTVILVALVVQICLGAEVIWSNKNPYVATAHMLTGAFLLASTWLLTLLSYRAVWWPSGASGRAKIA